MHGSFSASFVDLRDDLGASILSDNHVNRLSGQLPSLEFVIFILFLRRYLRGGASVGNTGRSTGACSISTSESGGEKAFSRSM